MVNKPRESHQHSGKSSKGLLNVGRILREIDLRRGHVFLDAGCGEGHFSIAASQIVGNEGKVYAIDIYQKSIAILNKQINEKNISNIETLTADITKRIPLQDGIVDVCLMADVLHGFVANREVDDTLREITRVLRTGSTLAVIDFRKVDGSPGPPLPIRMDPEEVEAIITKYPFKKEQVHDAGPYHYTVIFTKG